MNNKRPAPPGQPPGQHNPHALFEEYQQTSEPIRRRHLLRAIFDCGPPADGAEIWLLLREIRALVAELCSVNEAARLLLEHAQGGGFPNYRGVSDDGRLIDPRNWDKAAGSVHSLVNFDENRVSYIRLETSPYGSEGVILDRLQDFLPAEPFSQMRLVRLPLHDVLAMLHHHGLLPEPPQGEGELGATEGAAVDGKVESTEPSPPSVASLTPPRDDASDPPSSAVDQQPLLDEEAPAPSTSLPVTREATPKRPGPEGKLAEHEFVLAYWIKHPELLKPGARWSKLTHKALRDAKYTVSRNALKNWRTLAQKEPTGQN